MHKYEVIIYWSNEDQLFVAEVPELPGCMAHGETKADALVNTEEAVNSGSTLRQNLVIRF